MNPTIRLTVRYDPDRLIGGSTIFWGMKLNLPAAIPCGKLCQREFCVWSPVAASKGVVMLSIWIHLEQFFSPVTMKHARTLDREPSKE
jgi:hypothetical protein